MNGPKLAYVRIIYERRRRRRTMVIIISAKTHLYRSICFKYANTHIAQAMDGYTVISSTDWVLALCDNNNDTKKNGVSTPSAYQSKSSARIIRSFVQCALASFLADLFNTLRRTPQFIIYARDKIKLFHAHL